MSLTVLACRLCDFMNRVDGKKVNEHEYKKYYRAEQHTQQIKIKHGVRVVLVCNITVFEYNKKI